ncbi:hypothetical protein [Orrella dioscoreae]|uniref:Phage protein n=1 Tax=Orrella dioscoreae TaxID=1851544 RepID=A0A1C3K1F8_9BURK|nr:hypothetical protein [Orrella dioscoreae]SBT25336.1 Phage protein [Orrella dioscoreae]SOE49132.1 Phage protein [Orrella dioscoreae]
MRAECIEAVSQALGRSITQAEAQNIENRITQAMRRLAAEDRQNWLAMSQGDRFTAAAEKAAQDVAADAALKRRRVALTALRHDAVKSYLDSPQAQSLKGGQIEALRRMLAFYSDGRSGTISIESTASAIRNEAIGQMVDVFDVTRGKVLGLFTNQEGVANLVRELRGQDSGSPEAKAAARSFQDVAERLRQRFNRAGGDVGRLEDWGMPQSHSQQLVARAGRETWTNDVLGSVDRDRYTNPDGSLMTDAELTEFLGNAWTTVATNGANKLEPGRPAGNGMRANRGSAERQIHFRDAEAYLAYQQKYSDTPMLQTLLSHVDRMARDVALVESLGPNPNLMMRYWTDAARRQMTEAAPGRADAIEAETSKLETLYNEVSGAQKTVGSVRVAEGFDTYRSLNVASRLGSAAITAVTDIGTQALTSIYNGMPVTQVFMNELRSLNPASAVDRRQALRAGLGVQQFIGAVNRWGVDGLAQDAQVSGRIARYAQGMAAGVMKLSGMNALTGAGQQAFGTVMMDSLGSLTRGAGMLDDLAKAGGGDGRLARRLQSYGISDSDFDVWKLANPEDWRGLGDTVLTAESIYRLPDAALAPLAAQQRTTPTALRERAATRLMAVVEAETSMAVIEPGARERAAIYGSFNQRRGNLPSELYRSALQFKSFPIAMMMRHGARAMGQQTGWGKAGYVAGLVGLTTVMGGIALQLNEVASGRDPRDMTDPRFVGAAFMKGGALGIYGDFLFADYTRQGGSLAGVVGGPILGDVETLFRATMGNVQRASEGKEGSGVAAVQLLKGKVPLANLWYTKAATDRLIFNQLQELASPGYTRRMEQRARKEFKQGYWASPDGRRIRAPDLGAAVGE